MERNKNKNKQKTVPEARNCFVCCFDAVENQTEKREAKKNGINKRINGCTKNLHRLLIKQFESNEKNKHICLDQKLLSNIDYITAISYQQNKNEKLISLWLMNTILFQ